MNVYVVISKWKEFVGDYLVDSELLQGIYASRGLATMEALKMATIYKRELEAMPTQDRHEQPAIRFEVHEVAVQEKETP